MKIIFMGTPEFAVPCLERLAADGHTVSLVVTQADKPKGRGQKLTPPPVKEAAMRLGFPVWQPSSLKTEEALDYLRGYAPDVIVVVAYGKILPKAVLELPPHGCVNVHASLLPRYRGAAPIQWAVINGDTESGVTTMQMDVGLDTGDMLQTAVCPIDEEMTAGDLHDRLSVLGAETLSATLQAIANGTVTPVKQGEPTTPYAVMLSKSLCPMDFHKTAKQLHDQVRGLNPWPSATVRFEGKQLKVHRTRVGGPCKAAAGTVVATDPVTIACGDGFGLQLLEVQYEGGKRMAATDFFRGHPVTVDQSIE